MILQKNNKKMQAFKLSVLTPVTKIQGFNLDLFNDRYMNKWPVDSLPFFHFKYFLSSEVDSFYKNIFQPI